MEELPQCKINFYNMSAKTIINKLKTHGDIIHQYGDPIFKGGHNREVIKKMSKKERLKLSPFYEKSCQIADKSNDTNMVGQEGKKKVDVFYIEGDYDCGSFDMILNLINKLSY
jgi:hypothetical protein